MASQPSSPSASRRAARWRVGVSLVVAALVLSSVSVRLGADPRPRPSSATRAAAPGTTSAANGAGAQQSGPSRPVVRAPSAVLLDLDTGRTLFAKHARVRRPVASLVKIMTALLVLERSELTDVVTVSRKATRADPIDLGLRPGQRITVRNLLYGLLLWSGNDTAVALAQHVSGTVRDFVALMNEKARALGLQGSRFVSPNGLNDRGTSTAGDIAALARVALSNPTFASFVGTTYRRIPGPRRQVHRVHNLNAMLFRYDGATGVKTGYTRAAGTCVAASATRGGRSLIAVVLGDPTGDRWRSAYRDATRLLNYGFADEASG